MREVFIPIDEIYDDPEINKFRKQLKLSRYTSFYIY